MAETKSLHQNLKDILDTDWCYYEQCHELKKHWRKRPTKFIKNYFKLGDKESSISSEALDFLSKPENKNRAQHVISAFFMGILFYRQSKEIREAINTKFLELENSIPWDNYGLQSDPPGKLFSYHWFLTCLYHDLGYFAEEGLLKSSQSINEVTDMGIELVPKLGLVPNVLSDNILAYNKYRKDNLNVGSDHGISAGALLYRGMSKLHTTDGIIRKGAKRLLSGKPILHTHIAHCAWTIMTHNMWYATNETADKEAEYKKLGLESLIQTGDERKTTLTDHPLLFLLCLVDTIEPVKNHGWDILKEIKISFRADSIIIENHPEPLQNHLDFLLPPNRILTTDNNLELILT